MFSNNGTIKKSQDANRLFLKGDDKHQIANKLGVSTSRVDEYLERNSHSTSCPVCNGKGVNKQRNTGLKTPICSR